MKNTIKTSIAVVSLVSLFIPNLILQYKSLNLCDSPINREDTKYTSPMR